MRGPAVRSAPAPASAHASHPTAGSTELETPNYCYFLRRVLRALRPKAFGHVLCPLQPLTCGPSFSFENPKAPSLPVPATAIHGPLPSTLHRRASGTQLTAAIPAVGTVAALQPTVETQQRAAHPPCGSCRARSSHSWVEFRPASFGTTSVAPTSRTTHGGTLTRPHSSEAGDAGCPVGQYLKQLPPRRRLLVRRREVDGIRMHRPHHQQRPAEHAVPRHVASRVAQTGVGPQNERDGVHGTRDAGSSRDAAAAGHRRPACDGRASRRVVAPVAARARRQDRRWPARGHRRRHGRRGAGVPGGDDPADLNLLARPLIARACRPYGLSQARRRYLSTAAAPCDPHGTWRLPRVQPLDVYMHAATRSRITCLPASKPTRSKVHHQEAMPSQPSGVWVTGPITHTEPHVSHPQCDSSRYGSRLCWSGVPTAALWMWGLFFPLELLSG